ncbi:MAG: helix-turn-helix transcriptional regulator [Acidobacteriota bacterium]
MDEITLKAFRDYLRKLRDDRRLSQAELAERLGVSQSSVKQYEKGPSVPPLPRLVALLEALDADLLDLAVAMGHTGRQPETTEVLKELRSTPADSSGKAPWAFDLQNPMDELAAAVVRHIAGMSILSPESTESGAEGSESRVKRQQPGYAKAEED